MVLGHKYLVMFHDLDTFHEACQNLGAYCGIHQALKAGAAMGTIFLIIFYFQIVIVIFIINYFRCAVFRSPGPADDAPSRLFVRGRLLYKL